MKSSGASRLEQLSLNTSHKTKLNEPSAGLNTKKSTKQTNKSGSSTIHNPIKVRVCATSWYKCSNIKQHKPRHDMWHLIDSKELISWNLTCSTWNTKLSKQCSLKEHLARVAIMRIKQLTSKVTKIHDMVKIAHVKLSEWKEILCGQWSRNCSRPLISSYDNWTNIVISTQKKKTNPFLHLILHLNWNWSKTFTIKQQNSESITLAAIRVPYYLWELMLPKPQNGRVCYPACTYCQTPNL